MKQKPSLRLRLEELSCPEPNSGCVLWLGSYGSSSLHYGRLPVNGRWRPAHRIAWEVEHGEVPNGLSVLHKCDVPICINAAHLFLGTQQDNVHDMHAKGRARKAAGPANGRAKLAMAHVAAIIADPRLHRFIAADYGVSKSTIGRIKRGEAYSA